MPSPSLLLFSKKPELLRQWSCALSDQYQLEVAVEWEECQSYCKKTTDDIRLTIIDACVLSGQTSFSSVKKDTPGKILVIGEQWPEEAQVKLIASGVSGYQENYPDDEFLNRIVNRMLDGEVWIQRQLVPKIIKSLVADKIDPQALHDNEEITAQKKASLKLLTERESQVADLVFHGTSTKKIAASLFITERTVKAHLGAIFRKLEIPDRVHLAIYLRGIKEP